MAALNRAMRRARRVLRREAGGTGDLLRACEAARKELASGAADAAVPVETTAAAVGAGETTATAAAEERASSGFTASAGFRPKGKHR